MELKANKSPLKSLINRLTVFQGIVGSNEDAQKRVVHALVVLRKQIYSKETAEMIRRQSSKAQVEAAESELSEIKEISKSALNLLSRATALRLKASKYLKKKMRRFCMPLVKTKRQLECYELCTI